MKRFLVLAIVLLFVGNVYGEKVFTYQNIDNSLEVTSTEVITNIDSFEITIEGLKANKASLVNRKAQAVVNHKSLLSDFDKQIALIDAQIEKAVELGMVEVVIEK